MKKKVICAEKNKEVTIEIRVETLHNGNGSDKIYKTPSCSEQNCPHSGKCKYLK